MPKRLTGTHRRRSRRFEDLPLGDILWMLCGWTFREPEPGVYSDRPTGWATLEELLEDYSGFRDGFMAEWRQNGAGAADYAGLPWVERMYRERSGKPLDDLL